MPSKKDKGEEAFKGTISSVILSVFVLFLFLVPVFSANAVEKVRGGDGKYNFQDSLCYDIDGEDDLDDDPDVDGAYGEGALGYWVVEDEGNHFSLNEVTIMDFPLNGTMDGYGVGIVEPEEVFNYLYSEVYYFLTITKEDVVDLDVTRIDIYFNVTGFSEVEATYDVFLASEDVDPPTEYYDEITTLELGEITSGELTEFEIKIEDIMKINTFEEDLDLVVIFKQTDDDYFIEPGSSVVFDMQMYNVKELKIPSLTSIGLWMLGISAFMLFCAYIMLPQVTFDGLIKSMKDGIGKLVN